MYFLILNLWAILALPVTNSTELGWRDHFLNSLKNCLLSLPLISIFSFSTNPLTQLVCTVFNIYSSCKSPNWHLHAQSNVLFLVLILLAFSILFNFYHSIFETLSLLNFQGYKSSVCLFFTSYFFASSFSPSVPWFLYLGGRSYDLSTHTHSHGKFIWSQINMFCL